MVATEFIIARLCCDFREHFLILFQAESFRAIPPSDDAYADYEVGDPSDGDFELVYDGDGFELAIDDELLALLDDEDATISSKANTDGSGSTSDRRRRRKDSTNNSEEQNADGDSSRSSRTNADSTASSASSPSISNAHDESTQADGRRPMKPKEL